MSLFVEIFFFLFFFAFNYTIEIAVTVIIMSKSQRLSMFVMAIRKTPTHGIFTSMQPALQILIKVMNYEQVSMNLVSLIIHQVTHLFILISRTLYLYIWTGMYYLWLDYVITLRYVYYTVLLNHWSFFFIIGYSILNHWSCIRVSEMHITKRT